MDAMSKVLIPNGCEAVVAEYRDQDVVDYKYNPFIEALPAILSQPSGNMSRG